jgi:hypothetical protein
MTGVAMLDQANRWALALAAMSVRLGPSDLAGTHSTRHRDRLRSSKSIKSREELLEHIARYEGYGPEAEWLEEVIAAAARGLCAGLLDPEVAWEIIMRAAWKAKGRYRSWREWGEAIAVGFEQTTNGHASCWSEVRAMLDDPDGPWRTIDWDVDLLPARQRFGVAIGAPVVALDGGDPRWLGGHAVDVHRIDEIAARSTALLRDRYGIETRDQLAATVGALLHGATDRALALARTVALSGYAARCGMLTEQDAWQTVLVAAKLAQQTFATWGAFADDCRRAAGASAGADEPMATIVRDLHGGPWSELPWDVDLQITLLDPAPGLDASALAAPSPAGEARERSGGSDAGSDP